MTWFKVDDKLHDHRKARKAGKAAMGVWVLAGSWCMDNDQDGFVPEDVLARWGTRADAAKLVSVGLWRPETRKGEEGWLFHDWAHFQPSAETTAAWRAAESEAGQRGNHKRWHKDRGITDPNCGYCYRVPDQDPDGDPRDEPESGGESGANRVGIARNPNPYPYVSPNGETLISDATDEPLRDDVERVCENLANAIEDNGSKRPTITKAWRDEARRMLDIDGRAEPQVMAAIDWCQRGESDKARFWRPNVMSMTKLRAKFDQMRLQAAEEHRAPTATNTQRHLQLARDLAERESGPTPPQPRQIGNGR